MTSILSVITRIYSRLLHIYPTVFRNEFEDEMLLDFSNLAGDAGRKGIASLVIFCLREFGDFPINLLKTQWQENRIFGILLSHSERGSMFTNRPNVGSLVGGLVLIVLGVLAMLSQIIRGYNSWEIAWPLVIMGIGALFFVGMFAGGKSIAALAIPGSIISIIGLMLFLQNLFVYWQSWAYSWTMIPMSAGLGIFIMGWYTENAGWRKSGLLALKIGAILFVIFGIFFEMMIFNSFAFSKFLFPVGLILLGVYLVLVRSGVLLKGQDPAADKTALS